MTVSDKERALEHLRGLKSLLRPNNLLIIGSVDLREDILLEIKRLVEEEYPSDTGMVAFPAGTVMLSGNDRLVTIVTEEMMNDIGWYRDGCRKT